MIAGNLLDNYREYYATLIYLSYSKWLIKHISTNMITQIRFLLHQLARYKKYVAVVSILQALAIYSYAQPKQFTHDMALPAWGPYSNKFNGISHVPAENNGLRFDVLVQPSFYLRNKVVLANTQRESDYHPWQATSDLSYFSYRYELEWKDQVFCDVSFSKVDEKSRLIKTYFVNNTNNNRSLALNIFSSVIYPYGKSIKAILPDGTQWQKAADYVSLTDSIIPPNYHLVYNGQLRGQVDDDNAVSHTVIATSNNAGEKLLYKFTNNRNLHSGILIFRYRTQGGTEARLQAEINGKVIGQINFKGAMGYTLATLPVDDIPVGGVQLLLKTLGGASIRLDGFALLKKDEEKAISFTDGHLNQTPKKLTVGIPNAVVYKFDDIKEFYGLVWSDLSADRRIILDDNPDEALSKFDNLVKAGNARLNTGRIAGNNKGWFENIFSAPIVVKPGQKVSRYAFVVCGDSEQGVAAKLKSLNNKWGEAERIYSTQQSKCNFNSYNKAGHPYLLSQQLMAATTLTNLIYPVFAQNQYFKHTTPGKRWSSFYTWDSGFIGLGYSVLNTERALESLNAYTMDATAQSAYLEHGTPLPVQAYLFNELWNKTQSIGYLKYFYPRLKRYYEYLGGAENSPTRKLKSNLLQTWDIFYNSGGWDDYSPQVFVHKMKLEKTVAPTINTSHQIRFAKLLRMAAWQLGYKEDITQYDADINVYSQALQKYSWDESSGYFGYVKHDNDGNATGLLLYPNGGNFNMGLDGISPLIAGICTPGQKQKMIDHLFTRGRLWSDQGITAIDQRAPYYDKNGYWNGRVWIAHQWFIWKTMLDLNEPEKAIRIAQTGLDVWKRETDDTYNCWENFSIEAGNGGGWHQFGALSSPVLNWFSSLYKPGTVTHGFNVWPVTQKFSAGNDSFKGEYKFFQDQDGPFTSMLICLNDRYDYMAKCNGKPIPLQKVFNGLYVVKINSGKNKENIYNLELTKKAR